MGAINITEKDYTTVRKVNSIEIDPGHIILNHGATFPVRLLDNNGMLITVEMVEMFGSDYDNWGNSDDYVTNFILSKLGMTKL